VQTLFYTASCETGLLRLNCLLRVSKKRKEKTGLSFNNNNNPIYIAPACRRRMTSEALADSSSRATECLTEK